MLTVKKKRHQNNIRGLCFIVFVCNSKSFSVPYSVFRWTVKFFRKCSVNCCCNHVWKVTNVPHGRSRNSYVYGHVLEINSNHRFKRVCGILLFNHEKHISTTKMSIATKRDRVVPYNEGILSKEPPDPSITWFCKVT